MAFRISHFFTSHWNRQLPVPEPVPYIELDAPDSRKWTWNAASYEHYIRGSAEEFCLVVTQRRNIADTGLRFGGDNARQWLATAQCFAGPPVDAAAPRVRVLKG